MLQRNPNPQTLQKLIDQDVDCNLAHFDRRSRTFISPIKLAAKTDRYNSLQLLYEHRNSPTKTQLRKHLTFYINHHDRSQKERNTILFYYIVSRLLYSRITNHRKIVFNTIIAALHDFDHAEYRGQSLSEGSRTEKVLQLRIYTLFRKIIDMRIDSDNDMIEIIENELLYNLETYYFLVSIEHIPTVESKPKSLLNKCYHSIAKNLIKKIEQLGEHQEYTIPTGWQGHEVCVSFRRINKTYIVIRIDNPTTVKNVHEVVFSRNNLNIIKPKILGQLNVNNLKANLKYFVSLIDSVKQNLEPDKGISLIYNLKNQIGDLEETQVDIPCFHEQADANCFFKCLGPGFWMRVGESHKKLYDHLLVLEKNNANLFASRRVEEYQHNFNELFDQFTSLAEQENMTNLPVEERARLQTKLKTRYKQHYQQLLSNTNIEQGSPLYDKYVPLQFKKNSTSIELKNLPIESRVLMLGEAGFGKTTVCQYITYSWAIEKKLWQNQFDWLFYIKMRNLNTELYSQRSNTYSLVDIIARECFGERNLPDLDKQKLANELENSSNILWILDGCDERTIPEYLRLIERELLTKLCLLLTSRYEMDDLQYDAKIYTQSFTDLDIEKYIHNYFSFTLRTTGNKCWSCISSPPKQLLQTARIPACLEIICSLWENGKERLDPQIKQGELYQKMCACLLRQYRLKLRRLYNSTLIGTDIYQEPNVVVIAHLERLAFEATAAHRLTISGHEITNVAGSKFLCVLQTILLVPSARNSSPQLLESVYYFVHRSFQEYLCARYLIRVLKSSDSNEEKREVSQFITNEKYNRHVQETFRLFFELESSRSCIDQLWSVVDSEPRDLVGLRHCSRIAHWFSEGKCDFPPEDRKNIDERTTDIILAWIKNTTRRPHDIGNTYIFETFGRATGCECWLEAWKKDLSIEDSSKRRYFLPDLWSPENINVLKDIYEGIPKDADELHRLVMEGPNLISMRQLNLDSNFFTLYTIDHQIEALEFLKEVQEKAKNRESINTLAEFQTLLQNYTSFVNLNRQLAARGSITWRLKIAPSALEGIDHKMLHLLSQLSHEHALFYRFLKLPLIPFLNLYANQNDLNDEILSLIVSITMSSSCILTAPPNQMRSIRVYEKDIIKNIEMDEHRRTRLICAFDQARDDYGYSSFF